MCTRSRLQKFTRQIFPTLSTVLHIPTYKNTHTCTYTCTGTCTHTYTYTPPPYSLYSFHFIVTLGKTFSVSGLLFPLLEKWGAFPLLGLDYYFSSFKKIMWQDQFFGTELRQREFTSPRNHHYEEEDTSARYVDIQSSILLWKWFTNWAGRSGVL